MKRHKVDPDNLPTEEVIAINKKGDVLNGIIEDLGKLGVACDGRHGATLFDVTHYILKSDLLNLPEE